MTNIKYQLLKRASKIHAVKCNNSSDVNEISISNDIFKNLIDKIDSIDDNTKSNMEIEIEKWRNTKPIAHENEINDITKK